MQQKADLNEEQSRVVAHRDGHLLVTAGPGTGKTHTLVRRAAALAAELKPPCKILLVTFTNKAAGELRSRLEAQSGALVQMMQIGTFHSFAAFLLRRHAHLRGLSADFSLTDPQEIEALAKDFPGRDPSVSASALVQRLSRFKAALDSRPQDDLAASFSLFLRHRGCLDFDDLLREALWLLQENPDIRRQTAELFPYVCVDEYQDINPVQEALLESLALEGVVFTVIGDPDQSIYGFRGSGPEYFERFSSRFAPCKVLRLGINYRCARHIVESSLSVISAGTRSAYAAHPVAFSGCNGEISVFEAANAHEEARYIARSIAKLVGSGGLSFTSAGESGGYAFADIAVLYRLNAQARIIEEALQEQGLPCRVFGPAADPNGKEDVYQQKVEKISLMSMHASKGLEFPVVFLSGCESPLLPLDLPGFCGNLDEERRLLYVGMTRARQKLLISASRSRPLWGEILKTSLSPFFSDIPSSLLEIRKRPPERNRRVEARAQMKLFG